MTRRELIAAAARLGLMSAAAVLVPRGVWTQSVAGKDPRLISRAVRPPDFETPVALLDSFLTPPEVFFVRNHMIPPASVDESTWALAIDGDAATATTLRLSDLRRMSSTSVTMTLECAGNGRALFDPPVAGIQWRKGAVGTARWKGVRLSDLLKRAGVGSTATHVWMAAADRPLGTQPAFVRQIPIDKALHRDTIVAYEMNDRPIPLVNGAPLRMIVPGWEGAYSVKWLNRLTASRREHDGFWVANSYRYPTMPVTPGATVNVRDTAPLRGLAVKSLITRPLDGAAVAPGRLVIAGFAWAGETDIARVDVSTDGGAMWTRARLTGPALAYTWRRFECDVELTKVGSYTILSRATDSRGTTQPMTPQWNPSGYLWNAPDRIRVEATATSSGVRPGPGLDQAGDTSGPGLGQSPAVYRSACRACHGDDLIEQQRLSEAGWGRTVDKMIQWGAPVKPEERALLIEFLASHWSPR